MTKYIGVATDDQAINGGAISNVVINTSVINSSTLNSPALVTPSLGAATATSLLLNGTGSTTISAIYHTSFSLGPLSAVPANSTAEVTFSAPGVRANDVLFISTPLYQVGLGIAGVRSNQNDIISVTFINPTGASVTPVPGQTYQLLGIR